MGKKPDTAVEQVIEAVRAFYGDTTRSREATRDGLEEVRDEIETLIESLGSEE